MKKLASVLAMSILTGLAAAQQTGSTTTTPQTQSTETTSQTTQTTSPQAPTKRTQQTINQAPQWEWASGVSVGVAYTQSTGSPAIGGFNVGGGWRWKQQFELATDMDFGNVTTILGAVTSKTKRQNYLFGGRYYIGKVLKKQTRWEPFGNLMYGVSHESINTKVGIPVTQEIEESQTSWAWDFGGGVDYLLARHWALRGRADWLKTHFNDTSQSHFKWGVGFWYSFTGRSIPR